MTALRPADIIASTPIHRGYTPARRALVDFKHGQRAFIKTATDEETSAWLRREWEIYQALEGAPFAARCLGFWDDAPYPSLLLEDLSQAAWPPPWTMARVEAVLETLSQLYAMPAPDFLEPRVRTHRDFRGWELVAQAPEPFLSLGLCSTRWLERALPTLLEVQEQWRQQPAPPHVWLHQDLRSDNLCFPSQRAVLIDWSWSCLGEAEMDLAFWLPSLHLEGGPAPEQLLPNPGAWPAHTSGFWAAKAGLPSIPTAPHVRTIQRLQLSVALPWAQRVYALEPLDGLALSAIKSLK